VKKRPGRKRSIDAGGVVIRAGERRAIGGARTGRGTLKSINLLNEGLIEDDSNFARWMNRLIEYSVLGDDEPYMGGTCPQRETGRGRAYPDVPDDLQPRCLLRPPLPSAFARARLPASPPARLDSPLASKLLLFVHSLARSLFSLSVKKRTSGVIRETAWRRAGRHRSSPRASLRSPIHPLPLSLGPLSVRPHSAAQPA